MSFGYEQLMDYFKMECFKKKEERLRNLKDKSGSGVVININCELLNGLKENIKDYFYITNTMWNNNGEYILFSPKQAFDIYNKCNILLFNTIYPHSCGFILPLTEGYCKIVGNTKKENMKILFLNNSMNRILYQINSPEKINKLLSWLKEILTIGDYNTKNEEYQLKSIFPNTLLIFFNELFCRHCHCHGLFLQTLTNAAPAAVNGRSDSDFNFHFLHLTS